LKKGLRYTARIVTGILCLLLLLWGILAIYISVKKDSILQKARAEVKNRIGGDLHVGDWDISLFRHFPSITLHLSAVSLRDSLWLQHRHDLLNAKSLDISLSLFRSLLAGKVQIGKVYLEHGAVYFYTDTTGYTNKYLLRERPDAGGKTDAGTGTADGKEKAAAGKGGDPPDIVLRDVKWVEEKQDKHKLFDIDIHRLDCSIRKDKRNLFLAIDAGELRVNSLAFKTEKGSFVKDKTIKGRFTLQYNTGSKILQFRRARLSIGGYAFEFTGRFFPSIHPDPFSLSIEAAAIPYRELTALLTPNLQQKLDQFDVSGTVAVQALIDAGSADDPTPLLHIKMDLDKASVLTPAGRFNNTSLRGSFTNEWVHGQKREDENSGIRLLSFSGEVETIGVRSDTITITNLKHPILACDLRARCDLVRLNDLSGSQTLRFRKGSCSANLVYRGPLSENDTAATFVRGSLDLDSAAVEYRPYGMLLTGGRGKLVFRGQDLVIDRLEGQLGSTKIRLKGVAKNLATLLDRNAQDVSMDLSLSSPRLDLRDFTALAGRPGEGAGGGPKTGAEVGRAPRSEGRKPDRDPAVFGAVFARIDQFLKEGDVHLRLEAADLRYRNFMGAHAKADLLFNSREIRLTNMDVEQGGGSLRLRATLGRNSDGDGPGPLSMESHLERVDLPRLFSAFNNFGQQALLSGNLKGKLTADIRMTGRLTNKAEMAPNSLKGTVDFTIRDGQLLDFEPMEKVHEAVLKRRDLSTIRFADLGSQLDLDTTTIHLHRMEIQSTALTVFVEGIYDLKTGPDLSLQVPLSNLKNARNPDLPPANKGNDGKTGISVRLRARRGDDGKLKISWDPLKKALKKGGKGV
jgi:hypothetical protein